MRSPFAKWIVVAALVLVTGGHWALIQSVAWARMVVDYSQTATLSEAIGKTFDGQHPCSLCKIVAKESQAEKKGDFQKIESRLDLFLAVERFDFLPPVEFTLVFPAPSAPRSHSDSPPVPPPRSA